MPAFIIERHMLAAITIAGMICDGMGGLYLAYDLLGGKHGPLRILTRAVTYALVFALGYGLFLGLAFGLIVGIGLGLMLGLEFGRLTTFRQTPLPPQEGRSRLVLLFGAGRGLVLGLAAFIAIDRLFGLIFGLLAAAGLLGVYALGYSPSAEYPADSRARLRKRPLIASALRGLSTGIASALAGLISEHSLPALLLGIKVGFVAGLVSFVVSIVAPFVESWADRLPARRLGAFGTVLLLIGLMLQSLQYLVVLFDIPVR